MIPGTHTQLASFFEDAPSLVSHLSMSVLKSLPSLAIFSSSHNTSRLAQSLRITLPKRLNSSASLSPISFFISAQCCKAFTFIFQVCFIFSSCSENYFALLNQQHLGTKHRGFLIITACHRLEGNLDHHFECCLLYQQ